MAALVPPNRIVIDFLEGITSKSDAVAYARGFILSHFDVPSESGYYVHAFQGGYAYEVHEGGSRRAFLPRILKIIQDTPGAIVSVRSGSRVLQVSRGPRDSFNAVLLPEELSSYLENVIEPDENAPHLVAYQLAGTVWLFIGSCVAVLGGLIMLIGLLSFALSKVTGPAQIVTTPAEQLPFAQWQNLVQKVAPENHVAALKFDGKNWQIDVAPNPSPVTAAPVTNVLSMMPVSPLGAAQLPAVMPAIGPLTAPAQAPAPPPPSGTPPQAGITP